MGAILTPGFLYWDGFKYILTPGTFIPNGDLSGDAISQTVVGIQNHPVPIPSGVDTVLTWNGSSFVWGSGGGGGGFTAGGDLSGSSTDQTVISISGPSPIIVSPTGGGDGVLSSAPSAATSVNANNITIMGGANTANSTGNGSGGNVLIAGGTSNNSGSSAFGGTVTIQAGKNTDIGEAAPILVLNGSGLGALPDADLTLGQDGDGNARFFNIVSPYGSPAPNTVVLQMGVRGLTDGEISATNATVSTANASNLYIFGGSNTAAQNVDDGGAGADVNISGGTTNQVGGGGGDVNISGGRNLATGGGGGANRATLVIPGGYADGADIVATMAGDGDGGNHNFLINDQYDNTWFTVSGTTNTIILSPEGSANVTVTVGFGFVVLSPEGTPNVTALPGKFIFNQGWRRHITSISSGATYVIDTSPVWDDYIAITTLTAPFQINMPTSPAPGDTYMIKDTVGAAATFNVTVSGNGNNIDGASTFVMTNNFEAIEVTWTGVQWSIT